MSCVLLVNAMMSYKMLMQLKLHVWLQMMRSKLEGGLIKLARTLHRPRDTRWSFHFFFERQKELLLKEAKLMHKKCLLDQRDKSNSHYRKKINGTQSPINNTSYKI